MRAVDPRNGQVLREYAQHDANEVARRVERAAEAFAGWSRLSFDARAVPMQRAAALFRERKDALARLMASEMGKPVREGAGEAEKCAAALEYFAGRAGTLLADEPVPTEAQRSYVTLRPLGPVLAIMPWNFPLWQVVRFAAPSLMAGNAALVKHAPNVPGCALAVESLFADAGLPGGVLSVLMIEEECARDLIDDPRVAAVTLTGSTRAGRSVAARAGQALKRVVLELGGSDPYVVLADADVELAAKVCAAARMVNGGQSCVAAKRFIVDESVVAEFERRLVERMAATVVGDPADPATGMGPLARVDLRDALRDQVDRSVAAGARPLLGGAAPPGPGAWYPPTVLTNVGPGMPAFDEELFGPVAAIVPVRGEAEAVRLANQSRYGLGAAVFTRDLERGERLAKFEIDAGMVFVNAQVRSDPRLPFGGIRQSGIGRELGAYGIREFVNVKTVWV